MKTFNELAYDYSIKNTLATHGSKIVKDFSIYLDQRYAPSPLPGGAQPDVSPSPSESGSANTLDESVTASRAPAADNGGGVSFPLSGKMIAQQIRLAVRAEMLGYHTQEERWDLLGDGIDLLLDWHKAKP